MSRPAHTDFAQSNTEPPFGQESVSPWSPLRQPVFRALWIASVVSNVGTWMQNVGAAWLMTLLTPSPMVVALVQAATSLPVFLVALPAGALADVVDRWQRESRVSRLPPEHVIGAIRAGIRYVRHAPSLQVVLVRSGAFILCG